MATFEEHAAHISVMYPGKSPDWIRAQAQNQADLDELIAGIATLTGDDIAEQFAEAEDQRNQEAWESSAYGFDVPENRSAAENQRRQVEQRQAAERTSAAERYYADLVSAGATVAEARSKALGEAPVEDLSSRYRSMTSDDVAGLPSDEFAVASHYRWGTPLPEGE